MVLPAICSAPRPASTPTPQTEANVTPLREEDAYPASPQDAYGWEKLIAERLCLYYTDEFVEQ
jgi:nucleoside-diphosphate-sugar epimerase